MKFRPKILIVADRPNWAYHHIAEYIIDNLHNKYDFYLDFTMLYTKKEKRNLLSSIRTLIRNFFFQIQYTRKPPANSEPDIVLYLGWYMDKFTKYGYKSSKILKGIFTEGFPPQGYPLEQCTSMTDFKPHIQDASLIVCGTQQIENDFMNFFRTCYASRELPKAFFQPVKHKRKNKDDFVVGWTGNPDRKFKGFNDYVVPAISLAQKKYPNIKLKTRFDGPFNTLHKFYDNVDVVLIASVADAGPSMFMEASLRGVPSIANKSGRPAELIVHNQNGIFSERTVEAYANALCNLYEDRKKLQYLSENIRNDAVAYYKKLDMASRWDNIFMSVLSDNPHLDNQREKETIQ